MQRLELKKTNILLVVFLLMHCIMANKLSAINPIHDKNVNPTEIKLKEIEKKIKSKKIGVFKKWIIKAYIKKIRKLNENKSTSGALDKSAELGLFFGIISFAFLWLGILLPVLWIFAGIMALIADIVCIRVLHKTGGAKEVYKKARAMSITGLVFALLTGVIPLTLLILVLLSF